MKKKKPLHHLGEITLVWLVVLVTVISGGLLVWATSLTVEISAVVPTVITEETPAPTVTYGGGGGGGAPTPTLEPVEAIAREKMAIDLSHDGKISVADFSILAFWYGKKNPPAEFDLNHDGKISVADFSILAFYWKK